MIRIGHSKIVLSAAHSVAKKSALEEIIDPHAAEQKQRQEEVQDELKMKAYNQKLTLAQKLGLVAAPPKPLSLEDWQKIEEMSKKREDGVCAICLDEFRDGQQVILSCSHTFHKTCLSSFEKHNKIQACPISRRQHYDKRVTDQGFRLYVLKCCVVVQKRWRGALVRERLYSRLIEENYKATSVLFRRRLIGFKISKHSSRNDKLMDRRARQNENLLKSYQKNIDLQYQLMEDGIAKIHDLKDAQRQFLNQFVMYDVQYDLNSAPEEQQLRLAQRKQELTKITNDEWLKIKERATERKDKDCAICFNEIHCNNKKKGLFLLSCSHLFHANCLQAFERYNINKAHHCPICRAEYEKKHFELVPQK